MCTQHLNVTSLLLFVSVLFCLLGWLVFAWLVLVCCSFVCLFGATHFIALIHGLVWPKSASPQRLCFSLAGAISHALLQAVCSRNMLNNKST